MKIVHSFLQAFAKAWRHDAPAVHDERHLTGAIDIYELERRIADQKETRLKLYAAAGVGR
jgi:hypothetical protein